MLELVWTEYKVKCSLTGLHQANPGPWCGHEVAGQMCRLQSWRGTPSKAGRWPPTNLCLDQRWWVLAADTAAQSGLQPLHLRNTWGRYAAHFKICHHFVLFRIHRSGQPRSLSAAALLVFQLSLPLTTAVFRQTELGSCHLRWGWSGEIQY